MYVCAYDRIQFFVIQKIFDLYWIFRTPHLKQKLNLQTNYVLHCKNQLQWSYFIINLLSQKQYNNLIFWYILNFTKTCHFITNKKYCIWYIADVRQVYLLVASLSFNQRNKTLTMQTKGLHKCAKTYKINVFCIRSKLGIL